MKRLNVDGRRPLELPKGIRRKPNGKLIAEVSYKGKRESETVNTIEEAIEARDRIQAKLVQEHQEQEEAERTWTLQAAYDRTYALRWKGKASEAKNKVKFDEICAFFGGPDVLLTKITTEEVDKWVEHLIAANNSDGTINRKLSCLSTILTTAHTRGQLTKLPTFTRREEAESRIRFLTIEEEHKLVNMFIHIGKAQHAVCAVLLTDTGFRPSELWELTASQVNWNNNTISLWKTKTRKPRSIPMTDRVREVLSVLCKLRPSGPLLPGSSNDWFGNGWERVRTLMGLTKDEDFVPYALRHTCCSRLIQRGVPLNHAQKWMGHTSIQTTMRYAHLAPHDLFALANVLNGGEQARWAHVSSEAAGPDVNKAVTLPNNMTYAQLTKESWGLTT